MDVSLKTEAVNGSKVSQKVTPSTVAPFIQSDLVMHLTRRV